MSLSDRWQQQLDELRAAGRHRELSPPTGIDFSSNDYLGYGAARRQSGDSPLKFSRSGLASRLLRGQQPIWEEVEAALAAWHQREAALMFTSGYVANEGLLSTVIEPHDWVASDELNHASIIDGLRLSKAEKFIYRHRDVPHLETGLKTARKRSAQRELFIATESLFGMDGDLICAPVLLELARQYQAHLIVDEAHATGCRGQEGCGVLDNSLRELDPPSPVLATVHTGGKALGLPGAYVCGSRLLKELLVNRCRHFIFTTALPPLVGAWWLQTIERVRSDDRRRTRLNANRHAFSLLLNERGIGPPLCWSHIVPIILGDDARAVTAAQQLQARGFDVRAIRPPTVPSGTARLRISIHANHTKTQLQALADALAEVLAPA